MKERFLASEWADRTPVEVETASRRSSTASPSAAGSTRSSGRADGEGWTVVDWKTGAPAGGARARGAGAAAGGLPAGVGAAARRAGARVRGAFFYAATGETVWPELPGARARSLRVLAAARPT